MSETASVIDLDLERLVHIDQRIDANESDALRARWEFGRQMLAEREGRQFRKGLVSSLIERTGKSKSELYYRAQFAEAYSTEEELSNALESHSSWRDLTRTLKAEKDAEDNIPVKVPGPPEGQFRTFVADPPWDYGNKSTRGSTAKHYETMSIEDLCALDVVRDHAADESHLYLWTTAGHLPEAFKVMEAWGFEYKTYLVWVKKQMGMGNYFRVCTELVLFGVRGGLRTQRRDVRNHFTVSRGEHSAKPPLFHDLVEKASPGPYMELFARCPNSAASEQPTLEGACQCSQCRLGWTVWGNQS